jgi:hypothetical protein
MLYYLQMPKIGGVFHDMNEKAFIDYSVNARWITGWLQAKKITVKAASEATFLFVVIAVWELAAPPSQGLQGLQITDIPL